jgi:hypothetical protein
MAIPRADATTGQRLKKLEDWARTVKLMPSVAQSAVAPSAVVKSSVWYDSTAGNAPSYFDGTTWVPVRDETIAVAQATADAALAEAGSDGIPPTASPDPTALSGIEVINVRWTPITNADPVTYDVHVSTTLGFTADSTTLAGSTASSYFVLKALPGSPPADPSDPDPRQLQYDTTYYIRLVARDADGSAAQSLQALGSVFQVTGVNLAADSVTAANIVTGTLTGELFSATVIVAGTFKSAEAGQRVEWGVFGIQGYKSDGSLILNIPTDGSNALFDGELIVRGATILGGISIQSDENEITADGAITLMRGIVAPTATPAVQVSYDSVQFSTASLTAAQKTGTDPYWGLGGPFDLVPSEVTCIEWKPSETMWVVTQIRPTGSRQWFFNPNGTPKDRYGTGVWFNDVKDWEIWSSIEMTTSSVGAKNGVYTMFRFIPSGTTYYVNSPVGLNRYSKQNSPAPPVLGHNGEDMFVAEVPDATTKLRVRYFVPDGSGNNLASPIATYETTQGYTPSIALSNVAYHSTGFDMGTARYLVAERNGNRNARLMSINSPTLWPGGSGNNWASANVEAESFESPTTNRRATAWNSTDACFYTYGGDGFLYKHTTEKWDPAVSSSLYWARLTFYDSDATGGTHETLPGTVKSYTGKRRSKNTFTPPAIPDNGGTDDPDNVRLYLGRGATQPTNANFHLQSTTNVPIDFTTLATATASPPTVANFPQTNPALLRNDNDELRLSGDGTAKFKQAFIGTDEILAAWTSYTPTWGSASGTPTLGNGALTGSYQRSGKYVTFKIKLIIGTTTVISSSTAWFFSLPVTALDADNPGICGYCTGVSSVPYGIIAWGLSTTTFRMIASSNQYVQPTVPFAWASGHTLNIGGTYRIA